METITPPKVQSVEDHLFVDKPVEVPLKRKQGDERFLQDLIDAKKIPI